MSGGSAYFPERMVRTLIAEKRLHRVSNSPHFSVTAYMIYSLSRNEGYLQQAVEGLRRLGRDERRMPIDKDAHQ